MERIEVWEVEANTGIEVEPLRTRHRLPSSSVLSPQSLSPSQMYLSRVHLSLVPQWIWSLSGQVELTVEGGENSSGRVV